MLKQEKQTFKITKIDNDNNFIRTPLNNFDILVIRKDDDNEIKEIIKNIKINESYTYDSKVLITDNYNDYKKLFN